jgi:hypothetical protein
MTGKYRGIKKLVVRFFKCSGILFDTGGDIQNNIVLLVYKGA